MIIISRREIYDYIILKLYPRYLGSLCQHTFEADLREVFEIYGIDEQHLKYFKKYQGKKYNWENAKHFPTKDKGPCLFIPKFIVTNTTF